MVSSNYINLLYCGLCHIVIVTYVVFHIYYIFLNINYQFISLYSRALLSLNVNVAVFQK